MKDTFYYIYSAETDLPVCICETAVEAARFIGCCRATFYNILNTDNDYDGLKVLRMTDDSDYFDDLYDDRDTFPAVPIFDDDLDLAEQSEV